MIDFFNHGWKIPTMVESLLNFFLFQPEITHSQPYLKPIRVETLIKIIYV